MRVLVGELYSSKLYFVQCTGAAARRAGRAAARRARPGGRATRRPAGTTTGAWRWPSARPRRCWCCSPAPPPARPPPPPRRCSARSPRASSSHCSYRYLHSYTSHTLHVKLEQISTLYWNTPQIKLVPNSRLTHF